MPFGVIASPFLLEATIRHHLTNNKSSIASLIEDSLYMDNMLIGANDITECNNIYKQSKQILQEANMCLREYNSNNQEFKNQLIPDDKDDSIVIQLLGITWDTNTDLMSLTHERLNEKWKVYSKRIILSEVAKIFDPLGLIAPLLLPIKLVIQKLRDSNETWDQEVVDQDQLSIFETSMDNISKNMQLISISRYLGQHNQDPKNVTWDLLIYSLMHQTRLTQQ